jgi:hypothetical protein
MAEIPAEKPKTTIPQTKALAMKTLFTFMYTEYIITFSIPFIDEPNTR